MHKDDTRIPGFTVTVAGTFLLCASSMAGQSARPPQQVRPPQQQTRVPPQPIHVAAKTPEWAVRGDTDDGQNLTLVAASRSAAASQAQEAAAGAAVSRAAARIAQELFADPATTAFYSLDALRHYVRSISRLTQSWIGPPGPAGYEAYSQLQINKTFVRPSTVRQYVSSTPAATPPAAVGYLLLPSTLGTSPATRRTQVRTAKLRDGNFYFHFTILRNKDTASVRLEQIQVIDDGTPGKTRWRFVVAADGRPVFTRSESSYDDDVETYRLRSDEKATFEVRLGPPGSVVEIRITGEKTGSTQEAK